MTENPTIPSPSGPSQPTSLATSTTTAPEDDDPSGEINCICEISDDDGFTICCDKCDTWQHLVCVQITKENLPANYYCPTCYPRSLDVQKAKDIQRHRQAEEQAKRSHKKKRPVATSHKKKEHTNGSNGITHGKSFSGAEKAAAAAQGKPSSPKEIQQPSSRKRGHRASQSISNLPVQPAVVPATFNSNNTPSSPGSPNTVLPAQNDDTESDTDYENKREFIGISASSGGYTEAPSHNLIEKPVSPHLVRIDTPNKLACWADQLIKKIGDCPCSGGNNCSSSALALKPPISNGTRRKIKRNPSMEPNIPVIPKEPSPERNSGTLNDEDEDDNRSISAPLSGSKPRSRGPTPSTIPDAAVEGSEMTARDARKLKDAITRIEKQKQEEQHPQSVKRRKRNSTVSLPTDGLPLQHPKIESKDGMKGVDASRKQKYPVSLRSPYSPPVTTPGSISVPGEYTVTDASVGRRDSNSPVHSDPGRPCRRASVSPSEQTNGGDSKHRSKTITKPPRPQYVDAAMQTDPVEDETPWWRQDPKTSPPRPPRLPLRKRLMQSLLRDREEAVAILTEDKKRKHDDMSSQSPESTPALKSVKLSYDGNAPVKSTPPADIKQSAETESIALRYAAASTIKSAAQDSVAQISTIHVLDINAVKPTPSTGPALADIFADSDTSTSHQGQGAAVPLKSPSERSLSSSNDQSPVNEFRSSELHVQLPTPNTPSVQGAPTPSAILLQPPLTVVPNLANSNSIFNSCLAQPSPTRTKKLSLKDYGKRKQKVEIVDKAEEKAGIKYASEGAIAAIGPEKTPPNSSSSQEPRKLVDASPELVQAVSLSPSEISSHMMVDSPRVPTGLKEHRVGNWTVR